METCNSGGVFAKKRDFYYRNTIFFYFYALKMNFWTINAYNNEEFMMEHWEKIYVKFVEGFSSLFCIYWCKKDQKNLPQTSRKFFSRWFIVNSSLLWAFMVQNFCKNSFSGGKSRINGIPVIKITFSLQKLPQNYRFLWVNTKTIKYNCRFNTS